MAFESNKSYYSIGEVSRITGVPAYLLRYWEGFFSELSPGRDTRGNRRYTNKDIAMVLTIKELVYEKGFKIGKASQMVRQGAKDRDGDGNTSEILRLQKQMNRDRKEHELRQQRRREVLEEIKGEVEEILQLLG
ncbi:MerR family transcriptional regulator [Prosthecochloris sp. N3]|uniref:MerR family transcriptional regulator n=1 Tax=Prosthecochloris ethylica TaxID=2743976 RepID=A0ABR9XTM0_9CHLB|nr:MULTISPECIES: MerR family transcriptional regulator [Prosthecochloris]MEC9487289.1 MerR family transcriptional regulator [Prosthecochloris sp.]MBF0585601.1 MerR family transcriptional regulator [Prosthecochloris ethylica]MBF0637106.1 MerR family transcriptional regulator [Prosthecochloris ethylica]NUK46831.1 MerR family transcriptional regulator [Prosthecochloris ethylica]RNA64595.1 MerR family transcriptional regulator [Prosthecochloris sp. ZM_2]